jgi:hypothetical protein
MVAFDYGLKRDWGMRILWRIKSNLGMSKGERVNLHIVGSQQMY